MYCPQPTGRRQLLNMRTLVPRFADRCPLADGLGQDLVGGLEPHDGRGTSGHVVSGPASYNPDAVSYKARKGTIWPALVV